MSQIKSPMYFARKKLNKTIYELGAEVDLSPSTISKVERAISFPNPKKVEELANKLGITEEQIFYPERFVDQDVVTN